MYGIDHTVIEMQSELDGNNRLSSGRPPKLIEVVRTEIWSYQTARRPLKIRPADAFISSYIGSVLYYIVRVIAFP